MAVALGKRKRSGVRVPDSECSSNEASDDTATYQDLFRKAFEKKFKPLDVPAQPATATYDAGTSRGLEEMSEWSGLESEEDDQDTIEVIDHSAAARREALSKAEQKAFMQSKPPLASSKVKKKGEGTGDAQEDGDEKLNLKNDLALHRLIDESHLLHPSTHKEATHKQKVLDMRLQALGSKESHVQQEKMPLSHRRGITAKANNRDSIRRLEAKENGVILERPKTSKKPAIDTKRIRGVGGPAVGKFKQGALSLSKRDVMAIRRG